MILGGVDEAGYGPILGPLVVGGAAFGVGGAENAADAAAAVERGLEAGHGVPIGDSKKLHVPSRGPAKIEHSVLSVLAARDGEAPATVRALVEKLGATPPPPDHPWYRELQERTLPLAAKPEAIAASGAALRSALDAEGVDIMRVQARLLVEGRYNEAVERRGSKAEVLFDESARVLGDLLAQAADTQREVVCDRQGARSRYGAMLQDRFPDRFVRVIGESKKAAAYEMGQGGVPAVVRFHEKADGRSRVTGLASMTAKYLREVFMHGLNETVRAEAPDVKKTAGYWTDGLRFLSETTDARKRLRIDDRLFIRVR